MWAERVAAAAAKAVKDLRADDSTHHRLLIEDLEALIARLAGREAAPPQDSPTAG